MLAQRKKLQEELAVAETKLQEVCQASRGPSSPDSPCTPHRIPHPPASQVPCQKVKPYHV